MTVEKIYEGLNLAPLGQLGRKSAVVRLQYSWLQNFSSPTDYLLVPVFCDTQIWVRDFLYAREPESVNDSDSYQLAV